MKKLFVIAGCNGAGKTTASYTILPEILDCREFVNADEIAKGLSPFQPEKAGIDAGRLMLTIKAYAKWFGVDWLCALHELKLSGVSISDEDEHKITVSHNQRVEQQRRQKELREAKLREREENECGFDLVIGHTPGGFPYGINFEESETT